eukprot:jgi/Bigna1/133331/aug1.21_g8039
MKNLLNSILCSISYKVVGGGGEYSTPPPEDYCTLLGALTVSGGLTEVIRIGGYVRILPNITTTDDDTSEQVSGSIGIMKEVLYERGRGAVGLIQVNGGFPSSSSFSTSSSSSRTTTQRFMLSSVEAVPEFELSLKEFELSPQVFAALHALITTQRKCDVEKETSPFISSDFISLVAYSELQWRAVAMIQSLISKTYKTKSMMFTAAKFTDASITTATTTTTTTTTTSSSIGSGSEQRQQQHVSFLDKAVFNSMVALMLDLAKKSTPEARLDITRSMYFQIRDRIWWMDHQVETRLQARDTIVIEAAGGKIFVQDDVNDDDQYGGGGGRVTSAKAAPEKKSREKKQQRPFKKTTWKYSASRLVRYKQGLCLGGGGGSSSSSDEEISRKRLLQHWERHIIPSVQRLISGNLREYQVVDFIEQVRVQLRRGDSTRAIGTILAVCGNHCPDGIVFPSSNHNWLLLNDLDVQVGDLVCIDSSIKNGLPGSSTSHWNPKMLRHIGQQARVLCILPFNHVKARYNRAEEALALIQVYDLRVATMSHLWVPISNLNLINANNQGKKMKSSSWLVKPPDLTDPFSSYSHGRTKKDDAHTFYTLKQHGDAMTNLLARRALFEVISRSTPSFFFETQVMSSLSSSSSSRVIEEDVIKNNIMPMIQLAVAEGLNLHSSSLSALGRAKPTYLTAVQRVENNLIYLLDNSLRNSCPTSRRLILASIQSLLEDAMSSESTTTTSSSSFAGCYKDYLLSPHRHRCKCIRAPNAAAMILMFSDDTDIPSRCTLEIFKDPECQELIQKYGGGDGDGDGSAIQPVVDQIMFPVVVPSSQCFLRVKKQPHSNSTAAVKCTLRMVPIRPSLGIALWLIYLMCSSKDGDDDDLNMRRRRRRRRRDRLSIVQTIISTFNLSSMEPSPLKEIALVLISSLLESILVLSTNNNTASILSLSANDVTEESERKTTLQLQNEILGKIHNSLYGEMLILYDSEKSRGGLWISSYMQNLVHTMIMVDMLRPKEQQIVQKLQIRTLLSSSSSSSSSAAFSFSVSSKKVSNKISVWQCAYCTLENPLQAVRCVACLRPKKVLEGSSNSSSVSTTTGDTKKNKSKKQQQQQQHKLTGKSGSDMFHDMRILCDLMYALPCQEKVGLNSTNSHVVRQLVEACWKETTTTLKKKKREGVNNSYLQRMVLLRNIPHVVNSVVSPSSSLHKAACNDDDDDNIVRELIKNIIAPPSSSASIGAVILPQISVGSYHPNCDTSQQQQQQKKKKPGHDDDDDDNDDDKDNNKKCLRMDHHRIWRSDPRREEFDEGILYYLGTKDAAAADNDDEHADDKKGEASSRSTGATTTTRSGTAISKAESENPKESSSSSSSSSSSVQITTSDLATYSYPPNAALLGGGRRTYQNSVCTKNKPNSWIMINLKNNEETSYVVLTVKFRSTIFMPAMILFDKFYFHLSLLPHPIPLSVCVWVVCVSQWS